MFCGIDYFEKVKNLIISFIHYKNTSFDYTDYVFNFKKLTFRLKSKNIDKMHIA